MYMDLSKNWDSCPKMNIVKLEKNKDIKHIKCILNQLVEEKRQGMKKYLR